MPVMSTRSEKISTPESVGDNAQDSEESAEKEAEKEDDNKEKSEKNNHKIGDRLIESCTEVFGGDRKLQRKLLEVLDMIENDENYRGENDSRIWSLEDDITLGNRERFEKRIDILLGNVAEN
jgi:hypothetical protein